MENEIQKIICAILTQLMLELFTLNAHRASSSVPFELCFVRRFLVFLFVDFHLSFAYSKVNAATTSNNRPWIEYYLSSNWYFFFSLYFVVELNATITTQFQIQNCICSFDLDVFSVLFSVHLLFIQDVLLLLLFLLLARSARHLLCHHQCLINLVFFIYFVVFIAFYCIQCVLMCVNANDDDVWQWRQQVQINESNDNTKYTTLTMITFYYT